MDLRDLDRVVLYTLPYELIHINLAMTSID